MNTAAEWILPGETATAVRRKPLYGHYRFLLALMVMLAHYGDNLAPLPVREVLFPLSFGPIAVSCFFVLSGLIVTEAAEVFYARRPWAFIGNRGLRIVPPLLFSILVAYAVYAALVARGPIVFLDGGRLIPVTMSGGLDPLDIVLNAVGLLPLPDAWLPRVGIDLQPVIWTLRVEMLFYFVLFAGLLAAALPERFRPWGLSPERLWTGFLMLAGTATVAAFAAWGLGHAPATFGLLPFFALGACLHIGQRRPAVAVGGVLLFTPMGLYDFVVYQLPERNIWQLDRTIVPPPLDPLAPALILSACLLLLLLLIHRPPALPRRLDRALGDMTYPFYLNHVTMGTVVATLLGRGAVPFAIATVGALGLAWGATVTVDGATRRLRDRLRGRTVNE